MTAALITIASGFALATMWTLWLVCTAPEGFEDDQGFHFGTPEDTE